MVRILVIQFRTDDSGIDAEKASLTRVLGNDAALVFKNALRNEVDWNSPSDELEGFDGVILPGSAELFFDGGHHEEYEGRIIANRTAELAKPFVAYLIAQDFPTLGICFGHQLLAVASGSKVRYSNVEGKTGTMRIGIDKAGEEDVLFKGLPKNFFGQYVHKDAVADVPPNAVLLASNKDRCRCAALRYAPHVYSVQFHPERSRKDCVEGLGRYAGYLPKGAIPEELFSDTTDSERILHNFVALVETKLHIGTSVAIIAR